MFVLEALVLTFATTPLVTYFYPQEHRVRVATTGPNFKNVNDGNEEGRPSGQRSIAGDGVTKKRFTFVLDKLEHIPGMMIMAQLIQPSIADPLALCDTGSSSSTSKAADKAKIVPGPSIEALRLIELSDRTSAVMKSSAHDSLLHSDPLLSIFKMFGQLNDLIMTTALSIVPYDDLSLTVVEHAQNNGSEMIMLPWLPPSIGIPDVADTLATPRAQIGNPFDALFKTTGTTDKTASAVQSHFVRGVFAGAKTDVALFVDQMPPSLQMGGSQHVVLPFFGGPDDRLALDFVAQLCENPRITATIIRVTKKEIESGLVSVPSAHLGDEKRPEDSNMLTIASVSFTDLICPLMFIVSSRRPTRSPILCTVMPRPKHGYSPRRLTTLPGRVMRNLVHQQRTPLRIPFNAWSLEICRRLSRCTQL